MRSKQEPCYGNKMVIGDGHENFTGDMRGCGMGIVKTLAQ